MSRGWSGARERLGGRAVLQSDFMELRSIDQTALPVKDFPAPKLESVAMGLPVAAEVPQGATVGDSQAILAKDWGGLLPVWGLPASTPQL